MLSFKALAVFSLDDPDLIVYGPIVGENHPLNSSVESGSLSSSACGNPKSTLVLDIRDFTMMNVLF